MSTFGLVVVMLISIVLFICVCAMIYGPTLLYHHNLRKLRKTMKEDYQKKYDKDFEEFIKEYEKENK